MDWIHSLSKLRSKDVERAGGKGANLGELMSAGLPVPNGFVVTTGAYDVFMASLKSKNDMLQSPIPQALATAIESAHHQLHSAPVAVRASTTAEYQPDTSFAGQHETCLNVQSNLLDAIKTC
jgi:pyruvate,water dikinase